MSGSKPLPVEPRLWPKIIKTEICWLWTGTLNAAGYGVISVNCKSRQVHRVVYELLVGPIPEGLNLDHVRDRGCTNRNCCNPDHLEPVTQAENIRRTYKHLPPRTHCRRGHDYAEYGGWTNNWRRNGKRRTCRACERLRGDAKRRQRHKEQGLNCYGEPRQ